MTKHSIVQARTDKIIKLIIEYLKKCHGGSNNASIRRYVIANSTSAVPHGSYYKQLKKLCDADIIQRLDHGIYGLVDTNSTERTDAQ